MVASLFAFSFSFLVVFLVACAKCRKIQFYQKTNTALTGQCSKVVLRCLNTESLPSLSTTQLPFFCCWHYYYNNNVAIITFLCFSICPYLLSFACNRFSRYWRKVLPFTQKGLFARATLFSPLISPSLPLLLTLTFHLILLPFSFPFFLSPSSKLKYFAHWKSCRKWSAKLKYQKIRVADLKFLVTWWIFMKSDWTPEIVSGRETLGRSKVICLGKCYSFPDNMLWSLVLLMQSLVPFTLKIQWIFRINFIF